MILVLGGTSTTHKVIKELNSNNYIISVATEYGMSQFEQRYLNKVINIRFTPETLTQFIKANNIKQIIDSTHPHAVLITKTAKETARSVGIEYISQVREIVTFDDYDNLYNFSDYNEVAEHLRSTGYKSIIITTGGNNINRFSEFIDCSYVRILPFEKKSIKACTDAGFHYSRIIAMQGPFSEEFNSALIMELKADCLITKKNSGEGSGFTEKVNACIKANIDLIVINPNDQLT